MSYNQKHEECAQHIISMENAEYLCFKLAMAYKENQIYYGKNALNIKKQNNSVYIY